MGEGFLAKEKIKDQGRSRIKADQGSRQIKDQGCVVWALFVFNVKAFSSIFAFDCANFLQNLASFSPNRSYKRGDNVICEPLGVSICTYIVALRHFKAINQFRTLMLPKVAET